MFSGQTVVHRGYEIGPSASFTWKSPNFIFHFVIAPLPSGTVSDATYKTLRKKEPSLVFSYKFDYVIFIFSAMYLKFDIITETSAKEFM